MCRLLRESVARKSVLWLVGLLGTLTPVLASEPPQDRVYSRIGIREKDYGYVSVRALWSFPPGGEKKVIFVCWEDVSKESDQQRTWVREAVRGTWEKDSALSFRGWGACKAQNAGIRIQAPLFRVARPAWDPAARLSRRICLFMAETLSTISHHLL